MNFDFWTDYEFSFGNPPLNGIDIPQDKRKDENYIKIANYNNSHHGIIDNDFFKWALENNVSYESILWFFQEFSKQCDHELLQLTDSLFNKYTIFCDESNNCVKFDFKDESGILNTDWKNDFVLAGVIYDGTIPPFDVDELFASLKFQKSLIDIKLKHIATFNGKDNNRLKYILNSNRLNVIFEKLLKNNIYIHWSTQSLLYYALVDIVDSVFEVPFLLNEAKNLLYKYVQQDIDYFLSFLAKYHYPSINDGDVISFCEEFISWINTIKTDTPEEDFCLELLRQGSKTSKRNNSLLFLTNNRNEKLIESFVPLYALRLGNFPNSTFHFDKCGVVEKSIDSFIEIYCGTKIPTFDFLDSKSNKWIQLSDIIAGSIGALLTFINANSIQAMLTSINTYNDLQKCNLKLLTLLINKSANHNKYFDHMSCNFHQYEGMQAIQKKIKTF